MDASSASFALHELAVFASADAGQTGQSLRDACLCLRVGTCEFSKGTWALHINDGHPTISPLLDALVAIPDARRHVAHLLVEQAFGATHASDPEEHARLMVLEKKSAHEVKRLLELLAPTLQTLTLIRASVDPISPALRGTSVLKGLHLPLLQQLCISGPAETTAAFELPLSPKLAPSLRRLQVPSDMLHPHQASASRLTVPHLAHLVVSPLRARCTASQLEALRTYGENIGVFVKTGKEALGGSPPSSSATGPCVEVVAPLSLNAARVAEVGRLHWELLGWLRPELSRSCLKFNAIERNAEPTYEETAVTVKTEWLVRRREYVLR
ncbi:uncharacterized protein PHACADRAFT_255487 [Phanerochaete carnosa HHB-10118-sp]|uniref:Uncharacterized protein n=1 Tax=Phanerochaete carnosa (strain HHB-10118-sp) TaxID=650164 RepID=K5VUA8_PHACS|nr:uncharacterized protein PHACADRAFT_255487 [Phanerochaete carnosa HHB-10118-sp]EKM55108.1 hypothetical protein PHACADRAFT_255487 [Phanerochaete carnosa HHB-10118-sp]